MSDLQPHEIANLLEIGKRAEEEAVRREVERIAAERNTAAREARLAELSRQEAALTSELARYQKAPSRYVSERREINAKLAAIRKERELLR